MAETTGLPFEKKAIIPIDPRTKIFLTVTVSTIMVAGGTGGIMTVIRPCLMAFPMCLLLLSKRWPFFDFVRGKATVKQAVDHFIGISKSRRNRFQYTNALPLRLWVMA